MKVRYTIAVAALVLAGCTGPKRLPATGPVTVKPRRIISLAPSVTEMLYAVGAGDRLVGRDDYSDIPAEALTLPSVGGLTPNYEAIVSLRPDLVIGVSDLQGTALQRCRSLKLNVLYLDTTGYQKTIDVIRLLGREAGDEGAAEAVARRMKAAREDARRLAPSHPPKVLFVAEAEPSLYVAGKGTFLDELIQLAGGENAARIQGFGVMSRESLTAHRPDLVVTSSRDLVSARRRLGSSLRIVSAPDDVLVRPGPRLGEGLLWLSAEVRKAARRP